jgi:hypothetical protein
MAENTPNANSYKMNIGPKNHQKLGKNAKKKKKRQHTAENEPQSKTNISLKISKN